jgi:hypothetical protein
LGSIIWWNVAVVVWLSYTVVGIAVFCCSCPPGLLFFCFVYTAIHLPNMYISYSFCVFIPAVPANDWFVLVVLYSVIPKIFKSVVLFPSVTFAFVLLVFFAVAKLLRCSFSHTLLIYRYIVMLFRCSSGLSFKFVSFSVISVLLFFCSRINYSAMLHQFCFERPAFQWCYLLFLCSSSTLLLKAFCSISCFLFF